MNNNKKLNIIFFSIIFIFTSNFLFAENEEIYLEAISDQIQVITKDLKTLEKAVYQKSDIASSKNIKSTKSDGLNEDILTKHLLKLNDIEDQFRELTNKFEEVNFKLDKLSTRVTKIQSDTQLRFSDIEGGENKEFESLGLNFDKNSSTNSEEEESTWSKVQSFFKPEEKDTKTISDSNRR